MEKKDTNTLMNSESGIALMLVLWVITLLSIIAFEFCSTMRLEATITKNFRDGERSYYLANAGLNRALIELVKAQSAVKKFEGGTETLVRDGEETEEEEESKEWKPREQPYTFPFEDGECEVTIRDEGSKHNLNWVAQQAKSNRKLLADILEKSCGLEGEERDIIIDSIIDWVDKDHNHLLDGAEDEYYESLEDPYEARDGEFVVTEELLLVRGVTEEIFYGKKIDPEGLDSLSEDDESYLLSEVGEGEREGGNLFRRGLSEVFTVFSEKKSSKKNINDAPYELLMTIPGITSDVVQRIIELRREEEFENINDPRLMTLPLYNQIKPHITVDPTNYYRIEARGRIPGSAVARTISAVVELTVKGKDKYKIVYWQEGA